MKKRLMSLISIILIFSICGCTPNAQQGIIDLNHLSTTETTQDALSEKTTTEISDDVVDVTNSIETSYSTESTSEAVVSEGIAVFNRMVDLLEADYFAEGYADFSNLTLARKTTGEFYITNNLTSFNEQYLSIADNDFEYETKAVRTNEDLISDSLTVVAAGCELFGNYNYVNNQYLYCSGEIVLSGILRLRKQDDELGIELGRKGDVLFYPFPSDISELPMILSCGSFSPVMLIDENNDFYMISDTVELFLGNTDTDTVNTRINEIHNVDIPFADTCYNNEIENYLSDSEYYIATLTFSDLFLLSYQDRMTGDPYSSGNVSDIISIDVYTFDSMNS